MTGTATEAEALAFLRSMGAVWDPARPPLTAGMVLPDGRRVESCSPLSPEEQALDEEARS